MTRLCLLVLLVLLVLLAVAAGCRSPAEAPASGPQPAEAGGELASLASLAGRAPRATGGFASVVTLEPLTAPVKLPTAGEPKVMDQFGTAFEPRVLLAWEGEVVTFRNSEDVLHNVHVKDRASGDTVFNVATIPYGEYAHRFETPGVYDISCDTHPAMAAFLVVTDSPYAIVAGTDGAFEMRDLPEGRYRVTVWNLDPERSLELEVSVEGPSTEIDLDPAR